MKVTAKQVIIGLQSEHRGPEGISLRQLKSIMLTNYHLSGSQFWIKQIHTELSTYFSSVITSVQTEWVMGIHIPSEANILCHYIASCHYLSSFNLYIVINDFIFPCT